MLIRYLGPAKEIAFMRGPRKISFVAGGEPVDVEDEFGEELLGKNPDGLTVEEAVGYGVPVFEDASTPDAPPAPPSEGGSFR